MILKEICKKYGDYAALDGLNLEIPDGKITCVLGKSGAGKTTLLNVLAGVTEYQGVVSPMADRVGYVFQENRLLGHLSVCENLQFVGGRYESILQLLQKAGLDALKDRRVKTLSGGEKRRVALLRAFCVDAPLVLLDEPFSALDSVTKEDLLQMLFLFLRQENKTAVFVTHDVDEALAVADKIVVICHGKAVYETCLPNTDSVRPYGSLAEKRAEILSVLRLSEW